MIAQANSFRIPLRDNSVHGIITSIPYWNLRDYGLPPLVFGGRSDCKHAWGETEIFVPRLASETNSEKQKSNRGAAMPDGTQSTGQFCQLCGAWLGQYGLEPTISLFCEHSVMVARECKRVLRPDGVMFWNIGDSYSTARNGRSAADGKAAGKDDRTFRDKPFTVDELPAKNLCNIPFRILLALQDDGWIVRSVAPWVKCLSGGIVVYARTQKGDMPIMIKDLVRLRPETVKLWNGEKWTQVLGWQQTVMIPNRKQESKRTKYALANGQEANINYLEIELRTGERIGCTSTHQWPTCRGLIEAKDLRIGDIIERCCLPEPENPKTPNYIPDEIGWFVGMYLAEGSRSDDTIQIAGHIKETERLERLGQIARAYGGTCRVHHVGGNSAAIYIYSRLLNAIIDTYISGHGSKGKHLAVTCWQRNNAFLRNVLQGYLDGDGHWDAQNRRWRLGFTNNDALASDIRTLCARLGVSLRLKRARLQLNGQPLRGWRGQIRFTVEDRSINSGNFQKKPDNEIVAIRQSRARKFWDIAVEDEPHLFVLASGILTHNSNPMPESVRDRPGTAHEYIFMLVKSARYFWDMESVRKVGREWTGQAGTFNRVNGKMTTLDIPGQVHPSHRERDDRVAAGRALRTSDFFFDSLDAQIAHLQAVRDKGGMLLDDNGLPAAFIVNPRGFSGAHYATYPVALVSPMIKASTSERGCCPKCGGQWVRVTKDSGDYEAFKASERQRKGGGIRSNGLETLGLTRGTSNKTVTAEKVTTGWRPSCACIKECTPNYPMQGGEILDIADEVAKEFAPIPALILDPFCGSAATGEAAHELGRRFIGLDLSAKYLSENALPRSERKTSQAAIEQLPMFGGDNGYNT